MVREKQLVLVTPYRSAEAPHSERSKLQGNGKQAYILTRFVVGHKFGPATFGKKATVTAGNSSSSNERRPNEAAAGKGHTYELIDVGNESKIHLGETGHGSLPWHEFQNIKAADSCVAHLGDFDDLETKEKVFSSTWGGK